MGAKFRKVEVVVNVASGSVDRTAPAEIEAMLSVFGLHARVCVPEHDELLRCIQAAIDAAPDLLIVLAGDGTARAAAELSGPSGPLIVPLPGGTMNMLPHAVYGVRSWQEALALALEKGVERPIGGGFVEGHSFLVAAILGSVALWAPAREAVRFGKPKLALLRARQAMRRAFSGRLRYSLDSGQREKAEALVLMCPLTSRALDNDAEHLEAAALDVTSAADAFKLGFHVLTGDWRNAPGIAVEHCKVARVWGPHGVPAILDGESVRLGPLPEIRYAPKVARILAIPEDA